ncbi:hypothetical protein [Orrella marina]|uniref:hypothetical protein n=1 Tax=Orrella marina TaxID=2163011 RepID=UPI00131EDC76|nr:hypothetical protein [Orrella marina]
MTARKRNTPASASNFHLTLKASSASGVNKAPASALRKVVYDLGLDSVDTKKGARVAVVYFHVPENISLPSINPLKLAQQCEFRSTMNKKANGRTGQMLHLEVALPDFLEADDLIPLGEIIQKTFSEHFGAPAFGALHVDDGNPHLHSSIPLYEVVPRGGDYILGDRISHALRPAQRQALGLKKDKRSELIAFRKDVANLIGNAVVSHQLRFNHYLDFDALHVSERWRQGYCTLAQQVQHAAKRGDVLFVCENATRAPTRKNGPARKYLSQGESVVSKEAVMDSLDFRLCTEVAVNQVLGIAEQYKIDRPNWLRHLMYSHGVEMDFVTSENQRAKGVTFGFLHGPSFSGSELGVPLGTLKNAFNGHPFQAAQVKSLRRLSLIQRTLKRLGRPVSSVKTCFWNLYSMLIGGRVD